MAITHSLYPRSTTAIAGHPIHAMLVPFPIVCFILALGTDIVFWKTGGIMWQNFSAWLLLVGLVMGGLAGIFGAIDLLSNRRIRALKPAWPHAIGNVIVLCLALVNSFIHARDGWTAVVPYGLGLSVLTVLILLVTGWLGAAMVHRHAVGVMIDAQ